MGRTLTPCPAKKQCKICLDRLNSTYGSNKDGQVKKFLHCAAEAGEQAKRKLHTDIEAAVKLVRLAAGWAEEAQKAGYLM